MKLKIKGTKTMFLEWLEVGFVSWEQFLNSEVRQQKAWIAMFNIDQQ